MKLYTGTGDGGTSDLVCKRGVPKGEVVFDLLGTLDESSAALCAAATFVKDRTVRQDVAFLQEILLTLGSMAAGATVWCPEETIRNMEEKIDAYQGKTGGFDRFVTCYQSHGAAMMNLSRAVVRRAERVAVLCGYGGKQMQIILNRMSDLLFAMSAYLEQTGCEEI